MLGVIVSGIEVEGKGNPPMSHNDSLGVVGAGIAVGRARRAPQRVIRTRWGSLRVVEGRRKAPMSHKDSLGVVVTSAEC